VNPFLSRQLLSSFRNFLWSIPGSYAKSAVASQVCNRPASRSAWRKSPGVRI
jgi:hypothetical protein